MVKSGDSAYITVFENKKLKCNIISACNFLFLQC